jgi:hypothetical protein
MALSLLPYCTHCTYYTYFNNIDGLLATADGDIDAPEAGAIPSLRREG